MNDLAVLWLPLATFALAVLVLMVDVLAPPSRVRGARSPTGWIAALGLAAIFAASFVVRARGPAAGGAYEASAWTVFVQRIFLAAGVLGALGAIDDVAAHASRRQGEYWLLFLASLVGMTILPGARDLVLVVVAFELMSIPLYVLAAYAKTDVPPGAEPRQRSLASEASIKLYLVGATSTAVTLFGLALLTGMAGTSRLDAIGAAPLAPLSTVGLLFVLAGLGYKIGMVPFHMWIPDTYEGARAPFVAFLSVAPKAAGAAVLATIFVFGFGAHRATWVPPLALFAFLSMAVGNLLALAQTDLRRLLGYSGIAQMGTMLLALAAGGTFGVATMLFFLAAYLVTNLGAFLVVHATAEAGGGFGLSGLSGLARRSPALAAALLAFLLSLAGIPFAVGFWAKLYVLLAAWRAGFAGLVVAALVLAVLGLFYYLRVLSAAYMGEGPDLPAPRPRAPLALAVALCLVGVVGLGAWPGPLVDAATRAASALVAVR